MPIRHLTAQWTRVFENLNLTIESGSQAIQCPTLRKIHLWQSTSIRSCCLPARVYPTRPIQAVRMVFLTVIVANGGRRRPWARENLGVAAPRISALAAWTRRSRLVCTNTGNTLPICSPAAGESKVAIAGITFWNPRIVLTVLQSHYAF